MMELKYITFLTYSLFLNSEAANILAVFPTPSISHQVVFRPLIQELARRGHKVTVVTTDPVFHQEQTSENFTEIDVHDLSYKVWREIFLKTATGNKGDLYTQLKTIFDIYNIVFEKQVQTKEFQEILKKGPDYFDLLLLEACFRQTLVLSHVFKAPVIQVSSFSRVFGNYETIGAPVHPLLYPTNTRQRLFNLTFWEKVTELYNHYSIIYMYAKHEDSENEMIRRVCGPDVPSLSNLGDNVDMLFLNIHPIFQGNNPVPPSVIHMWGLHQQPEKELPEDIKSYLYSSKNGIIYISFGTNVKTSMLPIEKVQIFVKVLSQLPYNVLWKWNEDVLPGQSKNIRISKWFPQSDLLRHPKIKLFIMQGGLQSTDEAITAGVPLIGIPMLGDQWYNTEKIENLQIGLKLDLASMKEEKFRNAIKTVIEDESYRRNIIKLRTLYLDQPQRPLDRAVWWTEHVLRHGGARHLRAPAANMPWTEYLELELVFHLLLGLLFILVLIFVVVNALYRHIRRLFGRWKLKIN